MPREPAHIRHLRQELGRALTEHRTDAGWTQRTLADALHYDRSAISHIEAGRHPAARDFWHRADELLNAEGALRAAYEALVTAKRDTETHPTPGKLSTADTSTGAVPTSPAPAPGANTGRRTALKLSLAAALAPDMLNRILSDSAAEAMEFTRLAGISAVGRGTLEHLDVVLADLFGSYGHHPPAELFTIARAYRSRVNDLILGHHTLTELRELYVHAGCLSELLAWLANDLCHPRTAHAFAVDSYAHAEQAGHPELRGWASDAMATIATYAQRPHHAARAAMKGIAHVPTGHPLGIQLRVKAARAHARLGDRDKFNSLLTDAQRLHDHMPAQTPHRFTLSTGAMASYAITAYPAQGYLWTEDFLAAKAHSSAALAAHESAPLGSSAPGKGAMARLDLAVALTHLGAPDEAAALGHQALTSTHAANFVRARARELNNALTSRYPTLDCVRDFHEQYRQVTGPKLS